MRPIMTLVLVIRVQAAKEDFSTLELVCLVLFLIFFLKLVWPCEVPGQDESTELYNVTRRTLDYLEKLTSEWLFPDFATTC